MKVLIVTNQVIEEVNGKLLCIPNFFDILNQFSPLGELSLCLYKYDGKNCSNVRSKEITEIPKDRIYYVNQNSIYCDAESCGIIDNAVAKNEIIVGYLPAVNADYAEKSAHRQGKKFLSYVVGCVWDALRCHSLMGKVIAPYRTYCMRRTIKNSDYALYVTKNFLQKRYPCKGLTCGCSDVKIPDLDKSVLDKHIAYLKNSNLTSQINIATTAGVDTPYKGQKYMIRALQLLKDMGDNRFHYYLIGGGDKSKLENLAKDLGVSDNVHFLGAIPHEDIFMTLDKMHLYVQPSLQEGLSRAIVEAMSRALMGISFNTGAIDELYSSKYIINQKDYTSLANLLHHIDLESMISESTRNFNQASTFEEGKLSTVRNQFFNQIIQQNS